MMNDSVNKDNDNDANDEDHSVNRDSIEAQKLDAIGTLARSVAHDFNNWLTVISGHASSIADNLIPMTRAHEEALRILKAAEHASGLTKRLLSVARASNNEEESTIEPVFLNDSVKDALNLVGNNFRDHRINFKVKNLDSVPPVMADADQMLDCLMNLFMNASDAIDSDGTITIDASEKSVGGKDYVALRIRDTGNGMSKEVLSHAFDPFYTTKEMGSGIGLGLTVVRSVISQWGGFTRIRSTDGHGTSVRLFICKAVGSQLQKETKTTVGGETILIVDDNDTLLKETTEILEEAGFTVHSANSAEKGLSLFKKHSENIRISILDVVMPEKGGKYVLDGILSIDPTSLVVMTSGFSRDYVRGYLERGAWAFLQKPIEPESLLSTVRTVLDKKSTHPKKL